MDNPVIEDIISKLTEECDKYSGKQADYLHHTIERLRLFNIGRISYSDYLTVAEQKELSLENFQMFIQNLNERPTACMFLRNQCANKGIENYFYSTKNTASYPMTDFDTFRNFIKSNKCYCYRCPAETSDGGHDLKMKVFNLERNLFQHKATNFIIGFSYTGGYILGVFDETLKQIRPLTDAEMITAMNLGYMVLPPK